jgi:TP901 family phage tail tape measure protein
MVTGIPVTFFQSLLELILGISASGIRAASAYVEMGLRTVTLEKGLRSLENRMRKFGSNMATLGTKIATAGAISLVPAALGAKEFGEYDNQIQAIKGIADKGSKSIENLSTKFKELGRTTKFTAVQVATAGKELAKGGFNTDLIDASIEGVLTLAQATETELPVAADMVAKLLNSFKVPKTLPSITKFVDQLVLTVNRSPQALGDLFESLKNFAPLGKNLGQSTESLLAFNAALAKVGLTGTLSGTQIRRVFVNIAKVEKKALILKKTGIDVDKIFSGGGDVLDILSELSTWFGKTNMSVIKTTGLLNEIFEVRGQIAATAFLQDLGKVAKVAKTDLGSFIDELKNANGFAKKVADTMGEGLGNQFLKFVSAISGVGMEIGAALKKPLTKIIGFVSDNLNIMAKWMKANQKFIVDYAKVGAVILGVGAAMLAVGGSALFLSAVLGSIASLVSMLIAPVIFLATALAKLSVVFSIVYTKIARFSAVGGRMLGSLKLGSKFVKALTLSFKGLHLVLTPVYRGIGLILRGFVSLAGVGLAPILKNFPKILSYMLGMASRLGSAWAVSGFLPILVQIQALLEGFGLLKMGATAVGNGLKTVFGNIGASAFQATLRVQKGFNDLHTAMKPFLTEIKRVKDEVIDVFKDLQKKLAKNKRTKATALLDDLIKSFSKVFSILKGSAGKGFSSIFKSIASGFTSFKKSFGNGFSYIGKQLSKLGPALKRAKNGFMLLFKGFSFSRVISGVLSVAKSFILWELAFRTLSGLWSGVVAIGTEVSRAFSGFGAQASSAGDAMAKAFNAGDYIGTFNILWKTVENFFVRASVAFNNLYEQAVSTFNSIKDDVVGVFNIIKDAVSPFVTFIIDSFKRIGNFIGEALGFDMSESFGNALGDADDYFNSFSGMLSAMSGRVKKFGLSLANMAMKAHIFMEHGNKKFTKETAARAVMEEAARNGTTVGGIADENYKRRSEMASQISRDLEETGGSFKDNDKAARGLLELLEDTMGRKLTDDEKRAEIKAAGGWQGLLEKLVGSGTDMMSTSMIGTAYKKDAQEAGAHLVGTSVADYEMNRENERLAEKTDEVDQAIFNSKAQWDAKRKADKDREAARRKEGEDRITDADKALADTKAKVSFGQMYKDIGKVAGTLGSGIASPFMNQANALAGGDLSEFGSKVMDKFSKPKVQKSLMKSLMAPITGLIDLGQAKLTKDLDEQINGKPSEKKKDRDRKAKRAKQNRKLDTAIMDSFKVTDSVAGARGFNASALAASSRGGQARTIEKVTEEIEANTKKTNTFLERMQNMLGIG